MSWEWQTPRMQSLEKNHHQAFLVWQETAMKNLGKDFFCIKPWRWEFPLPPGCWQVTTTEKCRLLDHSLIPSFYLFSTFWTPHFFWGPNFRGGTFHVLQRFSVLKPGLHRVFTMLNWQFVISGYSHSKLTPHQLPPFSQKRHPRCSQDMWHCSPYVGIHGVAVKKNPLCQFSVRVISKVG